jgi:hypothetical protein
MAEDRFATLIDLLIGVELDEEDREWNYPTVIPRYWRSGRFPLHECVDRPELPCPACEAAASGKNLRRA